MLTVSLPELGPLQQPGDSGLQAPLWQSPTSARGASPGAEEKGVQETKLTGCVLSSCSDQLLLVVALSVFGERFLPDLTGKFSVKKYLADLGEARGCSTNTIVIN